MWEIDSILIKYKGTIDSYDDFENIRKKSNNWHELREISIDKILKSKDINESWVKIANDIKGEWPIEACLIFSVYLNQSDTNISLDIDEYNKKIIDILYNKICFNLPGNSLLKLIKRISIDESYKYKKNLLTRKFTSLKKIDLKNNNLKSHLLGIRINNISKVELINYSSNLDTYIYVANEDIEIIELSTGNILCKYKIESDCKRFSPYATVLNTFYIQKRRLNIGNSFERMLMYEATSQIYSGNVSVGLHKDIVNLILDNQDLFEKKYIDKIAKIAKLRNNNNTVRYISELIKNPNNETLRSIINESDNIEEIFSVLKQSEGILKEEIRLDIYVIAICKCSELAKSDESSSGSKINIALFCEELIAEKPIVFTEVINILKDMYRDKIFTNKTIETLRYLKHTVKEEQIIDDILLQIKYENCEFGNDFIEKITKAQENSSEIGIVDIDRMLNKLIYNEKDLSKYNNKIFEHIYNFYKRNHDLNTLHKLCDFCYVNNKMISNYKITDKDINDLVQFYKNNKIDLDIEYKLKIVNEFKKNDEIFNYGKLLVESIYVKKDEKEIAILNSKYNNLLKVLKKNSEIIYEEYLKLLESADNKIKLNELIKLDDEEIEDIKKILNKRTVHERTKLYMLKVLINYYIIKNNNEDMLEYMNLYMNSYSRSDNGQLFKNVLFNHSKDIDIIEVILNNIDFNSIPNADMFMNDITKKLLKNFRIDLLPEVMRYYIANEKYENAIGILKIYISKTLKVDNIIKNNNIEIDELKYEMYVLPMLENIEENNQTQVYELLIKRDDLPIKIRENYFSLSPNDENKQELIDAFVFDQTQSLLAKEFAVEEYYNNDDEFCRLVNMGNENSANIYNLIYKKVKNRFKDGKAYVNKLIENIYKEDEKLEKIYHYIEDHNYNYFNKSTQNVFGEYICISREKGEYADQILLKNIFDESELEATGFTDEEDKLDGCIYHYLDKIKANYYKIDDNAIAINEINDLTYLKEGYILSFVESIKSLIKLQSNLILNERIIIEFDKDTFIINEKGFIPSSYKYIYQYAGDFKAKTPSSNGKYRIINEANICNSIKSYLKNTLSEIKIVEDSEKIKSNFIIDVLEDNNITTYEQFIESIDEFIEKENKTFENITYKEKLKTFNELDCSEQLDVINDILAKKDTSLKAKRIILDFEDDCQDVDSCTKYLIDCFNNSSTGFNEDDYLNIYEKVNNNIKNINKELIKEIKNEIFNFYINAKDLCKIYKTDLENDIKDLELPDDDKIYLLTRT